SSAPGVDPHRSSVGLAAHGSPPSSAGLDGIRASRNGDAVSASAAAARTTAPTRITGRSPHTDAAHPATGADTTTTLRLNERIVAFIRARRRSGVTALR